jgi:hypothetical protein
MYCFDFTRLLKCWGVNFYEVRDVDHKVAVDSGDDELCHPVRQYLMHHLPNRRFNMKTTLTLMMCALGIFHGIGAVHAQTQVLPNGAGGYNVYGPQGMTQVLPNGAGGFNVYGSNGMTQILSNGAGGYNVYGSGGTTQVLPNGAGGYNSYGSNGMTQILPNGAGGFNTFGSDGSSQILSNGAGGFNIFGR